MTNNDLSFVFHTNKVNNEDCPPLLCSGWLAAADGMGGSGCMKHTVDKNHHSNLTNILSYAMPGYDREKINPDGDKLVKTIDGENIDTSGNIYYNEWEYFYNIFKPCIDDDVNTSARWASRIVMANFLYYVLEHDAAGKTCIDECYIKGLEEKIVSALKSTKQALKLTVTDRSMSILPTTLAAVHYTEASETECYVHAVWAGDSRCYLLDGNGLRKISVDDENDQHQLTNCFNADGGHLNCRVYKVKKPFILMCASDGFFDAYKTDLEVETWLLYNILNCSSAEELHNTLVARYLNNRSDDTSVAFVPVGFENYEGIKQLLTERYNQVKGLYAKQREYAPIIALIDKPEYMVTTSVSERFENKFSDIIKALVGAYYAGNQDFMLTDSWTKKIAKIEDEFNKNLQAQHEELEKKILERLYISGTAILVNGYDNFKYTESIKKFLDKLSNLKSQEDRLFALKNKDELLVNDYQSLLLELLDKQKKLTEAYEKSLELAESNRELTEEKADNLSAEIDNRIKIVTKLKNLLYIENYYLYEKEKPYESETYGEDLSELIDKINRIREESRKVRLANIDLKRFLNKAQKDTQSALLNCKNDLHKNIKTILKERKKIFTEEFIAELNMDAIAELDMDAIIDGKVSVDVLRSYVEGVFIRRHANDAEFIRTSLENYKNNPDSTSCIDVNFNARKLADFRSYYKHKDYATSEEFVKYRKDMSDYEIHIDAMLKWAQPEEEYLAQFSAPEAEEPAQAEEVNSQEAAQEGTEEAAKADATAPQSQPEGGETDGECGGTDQEEAPVCENNAPADTQITTVEAPAGEKSASAEKQGNPVEEGKAVAEEAPESSSTVVPGPDENPAEEEPAGEEPTATAGTEGAAAEEPATPATGKEGDDSAQTETAAQAAAPAQTEAAAPAQTEAPSQEDAPAEGDTPVNGDGNKSEE